MEKLEKKIVDLLQDDARYTPAKLAVLLGEDEKTVANAIAKLEKDGIIVKYAAIVNTEKTGEDSVDALIEIKVNPQPRSGYDAIAEQIIKFDEVKNVYLMSGAFDLVVTIEAKTIREVSMFVSDKLSVIEGIKGASTHFILKKYKESGVNLQSSENNNRIELHA
jgi:DNA-binding Lrp family transcriptional regulator